MNKLTIQNNYGIAPNQLLNSEELSWKAKGLFTYLQSKPDGWRFDTLRISKQGKDGEKGVRAGLQELEDKGYLTRIPVRKKDGCWEGYSYYLYSEPRGHSPSADKWPTVKRPTENGEPLSNKDISKKEIVIKNNFVFSEKLKKMDQDKDKRMSIISAYWKRKNMKFETEDKYRVALKRELVPAGNLKPYTLEEIKRTMDHVDGLEFLSRWTLETVFKYIDDVDSEEVIINFK